MESFLFGSLAASSLSSLFATIAAATLSLWLAFMVHRVFFPSILRHPYSSEVEQGGSNFPEEKTAGDGTVVALAGSYNPVHVGHLNMLRHLSKVHGTVYAIVGFNPSKTYDIHPSERLKLLEIMLNGEKLSNVTPVLVEGLIWKWCLSNGVQLLYRGIRTWSLDGRDETYLNFQNTFFPTVLAAKVPLRTVYLEASKDTVDISSTRIRELCRRRDPSAGDELEQLVGRRLKEHVVNLYAARD